MLIARLPWPESPCWPNRRANPWVKRAARRRARAAGHAAALRAVGVLPPGSMHSILDFAPPTLRAFDIDNAHAAMKGYLDGLFAALGRDDGDVQGATVLPAPKHPGGLVTVTFLPMPPRGWIHRRLVCSELLA